VDYGTPLVEDPGRVGEVASLGIDETAFLWANAEHPTMYVTGLVDLERRVLVDAVEGNRAIDVSRWLSSKDEAFLEAIARWPVTCTIATAPGCIPISTTPALGPREMKPGHDGHVATGRRLRRDRSQASQRPDHLPHGRRPRSR
jgi:hypothetical protein